MIVYRCLDYAIVWVFSFVVIKAGFAFFQKKRESAAETAKLMINISLKHRIN